ncbi:MAG: hypothetical protein AAFR66_12895 [Bacteroidota bacterium]
MISGLQRYIPLSDKIYEYLWLSGLMVLVFFTLHTWFGPALYHPSQYLFATGGDGMNIIFSSSYFVKYVPEGMTHTGFSYPYGNHLFYDDVNPLFSLILRGISHKLVDISAHTPAIINLSIILAFFPCAIFLYLILRRSLLPPEYAVLISWILTFLSPQIERLTGHLTLSYVCYVPMIWYFILQIYDQEKLIWKRLTFFLGVLAFTLIHPYYGLIGGGFLYAYTLVHFFQFGWGKKSQYRFYLLNLLLGVLPILSLKGIEFFTFSGASDFVKYPYGFLLFTSSFSQIFFSAHEPMYSFWDSLFRIKPEEWNIWTIWEGVAYVGFTGFAALIGIVLRMLSKAYQRRFRQIFIPVLPESLRTSIWAATLLLIWTMGIPFKWFPDLLDSLAFIRQFRSQGRLTWPFFYVFTTLVAFLMYGGYRKWRLAINHPYLKFAPGIGLILLGCGLWSLESELPLKLKTDHIKSNSIPFVFPEWQTDFTQILSEQGHEISDYQAILALPFYHFGTEKFSLTTYHSTRLSMALAWQTGLPMINTLVARAPLTPSQKIIQLMADPFIGKEYLNDLPNDKPVLLMYAFEDFSENERRLIKFSDSITTVGGMHFASLDLQKLKGDGKPEMIKYLAERDSLGIGKINGPNSQPYHFDTYGDQPYPLGGEALFSHQERLTFLENNFESDTIEVPIEISFWIKVDQNSDYLPAIIYEQFDKELMVDQKPLELKFVPHIQDGWVRGHFETMLQKPGNLIRLYTFSEAENFTVDNLMLRRLDTDIYYDHKDHTVMMNNFYFPDSQ